MYSASSYMVVVTALIDDCIPYVYMSSFNISTNAASENAQVEGTNEWMNNQVYDNFYYNVLMLEEDEIDGVIFDLRENTGGSLTDEKFLFGSLIDEPLQAGYIRYKTGLGKYDYSAWTPHFFYPGPYHRTGFQKPVVVISDIRTVSMAEVTSMLAKNFASGCLLGERTFGAHGVVDENSNLYDWSYSGIFGNASGPYWAKVSVAMLKTVDGEILEGVGVTPDIEMKFNLSDVTNGNDTWMDRAIEYVKIGK
jgi:C-terminal processing protease CtpA/Prc